MSYIDFDDWLAEEMEDDEFRAEYEMTDEQITLTNVYCLLDELRMNYENGALWLYAWIHGEMNCIEQTIMELEEILEGKPNAN